MLWEWFAAHQGITDPGAVRMLGMVVGSAFWAVASRFIAEFTNRKWGPMTLWWFLFFALNLYAILFYWILEQHSMIVQRHFAVGKRIGRGPATVHDLVGTAISSLPPSRDEEPELLKLVENREFMKALMLIDKRIRIAQQFNDRESLLRYQGLLNWVRAVMEDCEYRERLRNQPY
jgi:hypothetical protein